MPITRTTPITRNSMDTYRITKFTCMVGSSMNVYYDLGYMDGADFVAIQEGLSTSIKNEGEDTDFSDMMNINPNNSETLIHNIMNELYTHLNSSGKTEGIIAITGNETSA